MHIRGANKRSGGKKVEGDKAGIEKRLGEKAKLKEKRATYKKPAKTRLMREEEAEEVNRAGESLALCPKR
jgi:hypothetical protein